MKHTPKHEITNLTMLSETSKIRVKREIGSAWDFEMNLDHRKYN